MNKNYETKINELNGRIDKEKALSKKIEEELSIIALDYVVSEIIDGGTKDNIIALISLAKLNDRISEKDTKKLIENIDKYL